MRKVRTTTVRPTYSPEVDQGGFTMVELLAICVLFTLLSFMVLPTLVRASQHARQVSCVSNLRQIGLALQSYAALNRDSLPGPVYALAAPRCDESSTNQLAWFLARSGGSARPLAGAI